MPFMFLFKFFTERKNQPSKTFDWIKLIFLVSVRQYLQPYHLRDNKNHFCRLLLNVLSNDIMHKQTPEKKTYQEIGMELPVEMTIEREREREYVMQPLSKKDSIFLRWMEFLIK